METDFDDVNSAGQFENNDTNLALNKSVINYYKKFGRKRDLEQYFSLSTAQGDVRDRASSFWTIMKSQQDSSDSDKRSESATELCRISIKCSIPDQSSSSQEGTSMHVLPPVESQSPPIVTEDVDINLSKNSEAESDKYDLNTSQKSIDPGLDTSMNRAVSPTSSITSHRKLEWDSLADVGYDNENLGKNSASSLSTLERLALRRQYTINEESKYETNIGLPTAESTPLDGQKDSKPKLKTNKKLKLSKKDVVNLKMHPIDTRSVNVNLTKHISFNVDKDGGITENVSRHSKEDASVETESQECIKIDKEIQTTLPRNKMEKDINVPESNCQKVPIMINLNSLKKLMTNRQPRYFRRKKRMRRKLKKYKNNNTSCNEKSAEQVSEAESFEYMPGHIYNQTNVHEKNRSFAGNKSSLESSGGITTGSSKSSTKSFSKDLEKGVELLSNLHKNSSQMKKKLIKDIVKRLVSSRYKAHDNIDFLTGITSNNDVLRVDKEKSNSYATSSTSDHNSGTINKVLRPKKSILRKLSCNTTQSVPNLAIASTSEPLINRRQVSSTGHIDTDSSSKDKNSPESSTELYKKYLEAKKREQVYKKQLSDKDKFFRMKLTGHISPSIPNKKVDNTDKIVKDLCKNNYDGSGDANNVEEQLTTNNDYQNNNVKRQVIHPVFTLSSSDYDKQPEKNKESIHKGRETTPIQQGTNGRNNLHHCCCPHNTTRIGVIDNEIQVKVDCQKIMKPECSNNPKEILAHGTGENRTTNLTSDVRYLCLCAKGCKLRNDIPDDFSVCKCSHILPDKNDEFSRLGLGKKSKEKPKETERSKIQSQKPILSSRSSQTDVNLQLDLHKKKTNKEFSLSTSSSNERITQIDPKTQKVPNFKLNSNKCIQTDITINPKISDASLSDVNIYNEIFELPKQRSGSSTIENTPYLELGTNINIHSSSGHDSLTLSSGRQNANKNKGIEIQCQTEENLISNKSENKIGSLDEYILPLIGTNMELKVGIDDRYKQSQVNKIGSTTQDSISKILDPTFSGKNTSREESKSNSSNKTNNSPKDSISEKSSPKKYNSNNTYKYVKALIHERATTSGENLKREIKSNHSSTNSSNKIETHTPRDSIYQKSSQKQYTDNTKINENVQAEIHELPKHTNNYSKKVSIDESTKFFTYPSQNMPTNTEANTRRNTLSNISLTKYDTLYDSEYNKKYPTHNLVTKTNVNDIINTKTTKAFQNINENNFIATKYAMEPKQNTRRNSDNNSELKISNSESNKTSNVSDLSGSSTSDPIIDLIKDITRRYSKRDSERYKRRKCFKEIMTVLNYLVDTDDSTDANQIRTEDSCTSIEPISKNRDKISESKLPPKLYADKGIQLDNKPKKELSEILYSSDIPGSSSESYACKILTKIQKQCEEYNKKKSKAQKKKPQETSSSTSASCEKCKKTHKCSCKVTHKRKTHKAKSSPDKSKRKCIAYNLIIQASDSVVCDDSFNNNKDRHPLRNIIVKVPAKRRTNEKNIQTDVDRPTKVSPKKSAPLKCQRSRSLPNDSDISSTDEALKLIQEFSVREYLEKNRPDFIENTSKRQECLKKISETRNVKEDSDIKNYPKMFVIHQPQCYCMNAYDMYCRDNLPINCCQLHVPCYNDYAELSRIANERSEQRRLLSLRLARQPDVSLSVTDLRTLAKQLGIDVHNKIHSPKFISEKAMKKHSEKIYKTLPEVVRKKDELKKERIKKTNLIMASLFNKSSVFWTLLHQFLVEGIVSFHGANIGIVGLTLFMDFVGLLNTRIYKRKHYEVQ